MVNLFNDNGVWFQVKFYEMNIKVLNEIILFQYILEFHL